MVKNKKEVEEIEVIKPKTVKPRKVKKVVKYTFLENVGTDESGKPRYEKDKSYELTKKQIDNYIKNKIICQI